MRYAIAAIMLLVGILILIGTISNSLGQAAATPTAAPTATLAAFQMVEVKPVHDGRIWFDYNEFQDAMIYYTGLSPATPGITYACQPSLDHAGFYTSCMVQLQGNLFDVTRQNGRMMILEHKQ
jgi:hypothetical protein